MQYYGNDGTALEWFKSYLSNIKQYISPQDVSKNCLDIICGVLQGSLFGPLLFVIYVNDLFKASNPLWNLCLLMIQIYFSPIKTLIHFLIVWMWNMSQRGLSQTNCPWILIKLNACYFIHSQKGSYFHSLCLTSYWKYTYQKGTCIKIFRWIHWWKFVLETTHRYSKQ